MSNFPIVIDGGFNRGEEVLERLAVSEHEGVSRKTQGRLLFGLVLIVLWISYTSLSTPIYFLGWLPVLVILSVLWLVLRSPLLVMFPPITELAITNQRLLLRSGPKFVPWVLNYGDRVEVFVLEEKSCFVIRPKRTLHSPKQVYCKAVSPVYRGKQVAERLRSLTSNYLSHPSLNSSKMSVVDSSLDSSSELGIANGTNIPPGVLLVHRFLTNQLCSIIASIPTYSFDQVGAAITSKFAAQETSELGDTAYQFGVENE